MEARGSCLLFGRSLDWHNLRYIPFVGDGDSKSYSEVCKMAHYGPAVFIPKEDCITHVTEQMGTALRKLILTRKGEQIFDSFIYQSKIHFRNLWLSWYSQYLITLAPNNFLLGVRGALIKIKMNAYTMLSGVWPQKNNTPPNKRQV